MENEQTIQTTQPQSSVEFSSTSKGLLSYTVKVYNADPGIAFAMAVDLSNKAKQYCETNNGGQ